jgi:hypothetical protein
MSTDESNQDVARRVGPFPVDKPLVIGDVLAAVHVGINEVFAELGRWRAFGAAFAAVKDRFPGLEAAMDEAMAPKPPTAPVPLQRSIERARGGRSKQKRRRR